MSAEEYLGRVQAIAWAAAEYVSSAGIEDVQRLIDHGEPAEGMCSLAWAIVNEDARVPAEMISAIRAHAVDLVDEEFMPPDFSRYALA